MVELPDDLTFAGALALSDVSKLPAWLQAPALGHNMEPIARLVIERVYPHIAARVRAEAVAGERRRVLRELADLAKSDGEQFIVGWLNAVEDADDLAVGAVPVAAPPPEWAHVVVMPGQLTDKTLLETLGLTAAEQAEARSRLRAELDAIDRAERGAPSGPVATPTEPTGGAALIAAERLRQIDVEGWTVEHDDQHGPAVLLDASLCYQAGELNPDPREFRNGYGRAVPLWPWNTSWWKPKDRLRNLVRAGALAQAAAEVAMRRVAAITAEINGLQATSPVPAEQPSAAEQALAQRVLDAHDEELGTQHGVAYRVMVADHWRLIETFEPHRTGARAAFDRRAGEEEAQAELLGHRLTVGKSEPAEQPAER